MLPMDAIDPALNPTAPGQEIDRVRLVAPVFEGGVITRNNMHLDLVGIALLGTSC